MTTRDAIELAKEWLEDEDRTLDDTLGPLECVHLARALLAERERCERLEAGLTEALDRWEAIDVSDYAHRGNGYKGADHDHIAALRKLLEP